MRSKIVKLSLLALLLATLVLPQPASVEAYSDEAEQTNVSVPPGINVVPFRATDPSRCALFNLRFIMGGHPELKVVRIQGLPGLCTNIYPDGPDIQFPLPGLSPHEVTQYFLDNPVWATQSTEFEILVHNPTDSDLPLTIVARWD